MSLIQRIGKTIIPLTLNAMLLAGCVSYQLNPNAPVNLGNGYTAESAEVEKKIDLLTKLWIGESWESVDMEIWNSTRKQMCVYSDLNDNKRITKKEVNTLLNLTYNALRISK